MKHDNVIARDVGKMLNLLILDTTGGPRGDPDEFHMRAAARAFVCLKLLDLPIEHEGDVEESLRTDNQEKTDFLDEVGWPV